MEECDGAGGADGECQEGGGRREAAIAIWIARTMEDMKNEMKGEKEEKRCGIMRLIEEFLGAAELRSSHEHVY